jgi:pimeloyl-ACP methyl ester carboxylesterase
MSDPIKTDNGKPKRSRWRRIFKRLFITLIILALVLIFGVIPWGLAALVTSAGTRPMDRNLTQTPADFGAQYEDVEFLTSDGVKISGWLVPGGDKRATIVFSHGLFRSRRELLERAMELRKLGYGALLYDSRNHGNSGQARVSLGYNERLDVEAAVRYLRQELETTDRIVSFGISMGATAALLAAAETPEIAAVVSDSSFLSFDHTVDHHLRLFLKLPPFPIGNELKYFIQSRASFEGSKLDARDAVRRIGDRPIMFIAAAHDKRMPPDIARELYQSCTSTKRDLLIVEGSGDDIHGHAYQANSQLYIERVAQFLQSALANNDRP